jgi:hypothetical protein
MKQYVQDTCEIICEDNGRKMVADVLAFKENQYLTVAVEKSLKLEMKWNNRIYECKKSGLSFVSDGPVVRNVSQGRR